MAVAVERLVLPVLARVRRGEILELLLGHLALDPDLALDDLPALNIILHQWLTLARKQLAAGKSDVVGRVGLALRKGLDILDAQTEIASNLLGIHRVVDGVALESHRDEIGGRHSVRVMVCISGERNGSVFGRPPLAPPAPTPSSDAPLYAWPLTHVHTRTSHRASAGYRG